MLYYNIRQWIPVKNITIPVMGKDGKNVCFIYFGENENFLDAINFIPVKRSQMRYVYVPTVMFPIKSYLKPDMRQEIIDRSLRPVKGDNNDFSRIYGKNYFYDTSSIIEKFVSRWRIKTYKSGIGAKVIRKFLMSFNSIPNDSHERVLFYSVDLDKPMPKSIFDKKIFPVFLLLFSFVNKKIDSLPFEKVIFHIHDKENSRIIKMFDINELKKFNIMRFRSIIMKLQTNNVELQKELIANTMKDEVHDETLSTKENDNIKQAVKNYVKDNSEETEKLNLKDLAAKAIISHAVADDELGTSIFNKLMKNQLVNKDEIVKKYSNTILPRKDTPITTKNKAILLSNPTQLIDYQTPSHILELRQREFTDNLKEDIVDAFKTLENKDIPLIVKNIKVATVKTPPSELNVTIRERFFIDFEDDRGKKFTVHVDLPKLMPDGTFLVNGQGKILINQLIVYPIFFPKPFHGRFQSSYSTLRIHSKELQKGAYIILFMATYKVPIVMYLCYKIGFEETCKLFDLEYSISENKIKYGIPLPNKKYIIFKILKNTELGTQIIESFNKCSPFFPKDDENFLSKDFWQKTLEKNVGNRNCTHTMDNIWSNIVTPIEKKILETKGDPTDIKNIMKYMCERIVEGRVDDYNDISKLRLRSSELFVALLQKQIYAAYSEYLSKKLGGDENAELIINPTKIFSTVINSQNVQTLENINPIEEMSMMTRVSPIGEGGFTNTDAFPKNARNIHPSYYGNIDPLETPDGTGVGIQQHLTMGASISNVRGMFNSRERKDIKSTGILSAAPALIPFVESNDGTRVTMAAGQSKQAIPLENPEPPAIQSGYESVLAPLLSGAFIKKSPVDGIVTFLDHLHIQIKDKDGEIHVVDTRPLVLRSGQGKHGLGKFIATVEVGKKVKKDEVIAEGSNIKDGIISNGVNLLAVYMPWKGFNFEDGMVISESAAKKFTSLHVEEYHFYLEDDDDVVFIAKIGDELDKGDIILTYTKTAYDVETFIHKRSDKGVIVNIEVYSNIPEENIPETLRPVYEESKARFIALNGKYPIGQFKEKNEKFEGIMIKFVLEQKLYLVKGDKLNNRSFNKGVVSVIVPDEDMPQTPFGPAEIVYNPLSVINRMNPGQVLELHTSLICRKLSMLMESSPRETFTKALLSIMKHLDGTENKMYTTNLISGIKKLSDNEYNKFKQSITKDRFFPLIFPPFKSPKREQILAALKEIGLKPTYPVMIKEYGTYTDPVAVGYIYVIKLEHMSDKKIHSRSIGPYVSKTLAPSAGKKKSGGQKLGEGDVWSLLAWDAPHIIDEFFGALSSDHVSKNEMIAEIINKGDADFRQPKTNPVKEIYTQLMTCLHLEST